MAEGLGGSVPPPPSPFTSSNLSCMSRPSQVDSSPPTFWFCSVLAHARKRTHPTPTSSSARVDPPPKRTRSQLPLGWSTTTMDRAPPTAPQRPGTALPAARLSPTQVKTPQPAIHPQIRPPPGPPTPLQPSPSGSTTTTPTADTTRPTQSNDSSPQQLAPRSSRYCEAPASSSVPSSLRPRKRQLLLSDFWLPPPSKNHRRLDTEPGHRSTACPPQTPSSPSPRWPCSPSEMPPSNLTAPQDTSGLRHPPGDAPTPTPMGLPPESVGMTTPGPQPPPRRSLFPSPSPTEVQYLGPPDLPTLSVPSEVQFLGPAGPPVLQAVSPSGDVRLTLRCYAPTDSITSAHLRLRMDLRILPRDLYSIPSDGHCGYHSLAVLSHPQYPSPPSAQERHELHSELLLRLTQSTDPALRAAAHATHQHPPPRLLPHQHWLNSTWLHLIPDLPPIGCLALLNDSDLHTTSPWYYCTALSCASSQLEHSLPDLIRVADSGRLLLHSSAHYYPVTPPAFLTLALRQCSDLLQRQLGGSSSLDLLRLPVDPRPPPPPIRRYTSIRAHPGGLQLGLGPSSLSAEAQWGVFTLKTIPSGTRILEYGGQLRSHQWLDTPGQNLIYVWSDLDNHASLKKSGQLPVIIDAHPAYTDSWGGGVLTTVWHREQMWKSGEINTLIKHTFGPLKLSPQGWN